MTTQTANDPYVYWGVANAIDDEILSLQEEIARETLTWQMIIKFRDVLDRLIQEELGDDD